MSKRTVLVVEDDLLIRVMLVEALQDDAYAVTQAANVLEAVAAVGRNPSFDALVTDVDMPGNLTGLDLAKMVSSVSPRTKVVIVTGSRCQRRRWAGVDFHAKATQFKSAPELAG